MLSVPLFLFVTDMFIYFIHRGLHHPLVYRRIHKPHHTYRWTTPYSSHAFAPLDGFSQGVPYYIFTFIFPFHNWLWLVMFLFVNFWTISIHDQVRYGGCWGQLLLHVRPMVGRSICMGCQSKTSPPHWGRPAVTRCLSMVGNINNRHRVTAVTCSYMCWDICEHGQWRVGKEVGG